MEVDVGVIKIIGPDTMTVDEFGRFIDVILLRMDKLSNYAGLTAAAAPATTSTSVALTPT